MFDEIYFGAKGPQPASLGSMTVHRTDIYQGKQDASEVLGWATFSSYHTLAYDQGFPGLMPLWLLIYGNFIILDLSLSPVVIATAS